MKTKRACIYPKDIQRITGKSERYAQKYFNKIKQHYNKTTDQFLTVQEFCAYTALDISLVESYLEH
jgi:hypothetical protein